MFSVIFCLNELTTHIFGRKQKKIILKKFIYTYNKISVNIKLISQTKQEIKNITRKVKGETF